MADSDQRLHVLETGSSFYADLVVVCGGYVFASDDDNAVTNPVVIVEVLSPSTADYDRGTKFQNYRRIASLQEFVLVSQHERRVEVRRRISEGWLVVEMTEGELELSSLNISVPLDEVYDLDGVRDEAPPVD